VEGKPRSSFVRSYLVATTVGAAVALVDYAINLWMSARGLHAEATLLDELLIGIFTGVLVLVLEFAHKRDQERMNEKLRTIELMNHHVRNALQTIVDSAYIHGHLDDVRNSVDRIAWALQEILPGNTEDFKGLSHLQAPRT
jgi:hypothetical protein